MNKLFNKSRDEYIIIFLAFLTLVTIPFSIFRLYVHFSYGQKLKDDNCLCSETWKRDIVQYGPFYFMFFFILLSNIVIVNSQLRIYIKYLFSICSSILTVIYLSYIYELIKIECECSKNWRRTYITVFEIFKIIVQLFSLFFVYYLQFLL